MSGRMNLPLWRFSACPLKELNDCGGFQRVHSRDWTAVECQDGSSPSVRLSHILWFQARTLKLFGHGFCGYYMINGLLHSSLWMSRSAVAITQKTLLFWQHTLPLNIFWQVWVRNDRVTSITSHVLDKFCMCCWWTEVLVSRIYELQRPKRLFFLN